MATSNSQWEFFFPLKKTRIEENGDSAEIQAVSDPMCSRGSPTTSLVIHLRRRKTLRYNGSSDQLDDYSDSQWEGKDLVVSHKLKDLFVSSPPSPDEKSSGLWLQKLFNTGANELTRSVNKELVEFESAMANMEVISEQTFGKISHENAKTTTI
nr:uncharacterized protein LOC109177626 isoform X1 [Ipomoea batatas]